MDKHLEDAEKHLATIQRKTAEAGGLMGWGRLPRAPPSVARPPPARSLRKTHQNPPTTKPTAKATAEIRGKTKELEKQIAAQQERLAAQDEELRKQNAAKAQAEGEVAALNTRLQNANQHLAGLEEEARQLADSRDAAIFEAGEEGAAFADEMAALLEEAKQLLALPPPPPSPPVQQEEGGGEAAAPAAEGGAGAAAEAGEGAPLEETQVVERGEEAMAE
jgi:DNA repair exonuclease SbcCD ATPase subunit